MVLVVLRIKFIMDTALLKIKVLVRIDEYLVKRTEKRNIGRGMQYENTKFDRN